MILAKLKNYFEDNTCGEIIAKIIMDIFIGVGVYFVVWCILALHQVITPTFPIWVVVLDLILSLAFLLGCIGAREDLY